MSRLRNSCTIVVLASAAVLLTPTVAFAGGQEEDLHDEQTEGDSSGDGSIEAGAGGGGIRLTFTPAASSPEGALSSPVWKPPACYYAPMFTPAEMRRWWLDLHSPGWPPEDQASLARSEKEFLEEFPDYNADRAGEGSFWRVVRNKDYPIEERNACEYKTFWHDFDDPELPDDEHAIDVEMLAELAWEETRVPDPELSLNPVGVADQVVNLPMWVWLDEEQFAPVSVRAELDDYGIWSEVTAVPQSLELEPGSDRAQVYPSSGVCRVQDGGIGEPYAEGRGEDDPPCGVRWGRASHADGGFTLTATLTWGVTWRDSQDDTPRDLADGVVEETVEITVEELQTIVRP